MSDGKKYYCFCSSNCRYETMTKEQILAAIEQAVSGGKINNVDTGFVSKVKENNASGYVSFWVGTQAQYNALTSIAANCLYIITDETTSEDLEKFVNQMAEQCKASAASAAAAAAAATTIDFSDRIALSSLISGGGQNLSSLRVNRTDYIYAPAMKMVFFVVNIVFSGKLSKGEQLVFKHARPETNEGIFKPRAVGGSTYPVTSRSAAFSAEYWSDQLVVLVNEDIDTEEISESVDLSGWYFCDGE